MKAASGSSDARLRRSGEIQTTCISTSRAARKNARSRDCRRVSALSLTPQSPKKNNAGKPNKNERKSVPGSAPRTLNAVREDTHDEGAEGRVGRKHSHNADHRQGTQGDRQARQEATRAATQDLSRSPRQSRGLHHPYHR